ncbi:MAG: DUF502 domain-containing protein [Desulfobacterota bacterium]|nr:DUF502 domain-containing protein [Thermodesulfobacteriota bacterium]
MKRLLRHLRTKIIAGLLVILPLGITVFILKFVFTALDDLVGPLGPRVTQFLFQREIHLPGLGIIIFLLLLYLLGVITTNVMGRKLVGWTDRILTNLPIVKNIYLSSKQLTEAFSTSRKGSFRQAVFVEFPQPGNFVLGFITNEFSDLTSRSKITVFVPTAFIPPQGFTLFLPREKVIPSQLTIEEAIKAVMSVGIVTPARLSVSLSEPVAAQKSFEKEQRPVYPNLKIEGGS